MQSRRGPGQRAAQECTARIAGLAKLAEELNVPGTPEIVFSNGKLVPGAVPFPTARKVVPCERDVATLRRCALG